MFYIISHDNVKPSQCHKQEYFHIINNVATNMNCLILGGKIAQSCAQNVILLKTDIIL